MIKKLLNNPIINRMCHKYQWLGKLLCRLNLNHSLYITGLRDLEITARCRYCGKEFKGEKL